MTEGVPQSSFSVVDVAWDTVWLSLAINAAAATADLFSSKARGVSQVVTHPLPSELPTSFWWSIKLDVLQLRNRLIY